MKAGQRTRTNTHAQTKGWESHSDTMLTGVRSGGSEIAESVSVSVNLSCAASQFYRRRQNVTEENNWHAA